MCDVLAREVAEEVFEDCQSSSEDELYEDCPAAEDYFCPVKDHFSPVQDRITPVEEHTSPAKGLTSPIEECTNSAKDHTSPTKDCISLVEEHISPPTAGRTSPVPGAPKPAEVCDIPAEDRPRSVSSPAGSGDAPLTAPVGDPATTAAPAAAPVAVEEKDSDQRLAPSESSVPASSPTSETPMTDAGKDLTVCEAPGTAPVAVPSDVVTVASCDLGGTGDWDVSEGDEQARGSLSSEGDSSESSSAPEGMARSWHVLDPSDSTAASPVTSPTSTASAVAAAVSTTSDVAAAISAAAAPVSSAAAEETPASPLDEAAPRPAGPAPDIAQLADAVSDSVPTPASDSDPSPDASAAGDLPSAGGAAAAQRDSDDDAEMVTDPDAVDEEALRQQDEAETEEEREARRERAVQLKTDGNQLYASAAYDAARERYTAALRVCPLSAARERAVLLSNRAACRARADDETGAVADCSRSLELDPEYARPLQRRAELHERAERLDEALEDWKRLLELKPDCGEARRAVVRLPPQIAERNEKLKNEMLGKLKDLGNMFMRPFGLSTDNFQMEQNESGGYSVKFKQT